MQTMSDEEMLARVEQLNEMVQEKFDALTETAPVTMDANDVIAEIQALADEIEDKERRLREQRNMIEDLKSTKYDNRLRGELDIAQTELLSLRSVLRGGRDFHRENDELKSELKRLKETKIATTERELTKLRDELAQSCETMQTAAVQKMKETLFKFMGATMEKVSVALAGKQNMNDHDISSTIYDVMRQCSDEIMRGIDEQSIL